MSVAAPTPSRDTAASLLEPEIGWESIGAACRSALSRYAERLGLSVHEGELAPHERFRYEIRDVPFPDGVGSGTIRAWGEVVFGDQARVRIELNHDRVFLGTDKHLYPNDYCFARRVRPGREPGEMVFRQALASAEQARVRLNTIEANRKRQGVILSQRVRAALRPEETPPPTSS